MKYLEDFLNSNNYELTLLQKDQFQFFVDLLLETNKVMNLTAIDDPVQVEIKHLVDSLQSINFLRTEVPAGFTLIDVGCGAGFPGIPLKILFPDNSFVLLDSLNKRIRFVNQVISELNLSDVQAVAARAEDHANVSRETFDVCTSRAVARMSALLEYCLPFVKIGGYAVLYKSGDVKEELEESSKAIKVLGGKLEKVINSELPEESGSRSLVIIKKVSHTPGKYPRKAGTPTRMPIV